MEIIDTIQCDACSHRWDAIWKCVSIGPSDEVGIVSSCNRCWFHYRLPSTVERYRWEDWLKAFRASDEVRGPEINAFVSAIDEEFQDRPHYPRLPFPTIVVR